MALNRQIDKADRQLYLLVGLVVLFGLAAVVASIPFLLVGADEVRPWPVWPALGALALLVALGELLNVEVRVRSTLHGMSWADAAVLIGLAVMPVPWVVVATAAGMALAKVIQRRSLLKSAFGVAKESTTALLGGLVLLGLGYAGSVGAADLASLALAFAAITFADPLLTIPVIALSSRTPVVDRFRANWDIRLVANAGRLMVAMAAVLALQMEPTLIYALPVAVIIAHLWHERWVRAREEREAWQNLAAATEAFTGVDLDVVLRESVIRGAKLFSADVIEVEVWLGLSRRLIRGTDEITYDGDPAQAPADGMGVYAVALHGYEGRRDIGALRLRFRNQVKTSAREQAMVASYAAALETAVRNAAAYQQLGEATEAHAYAAAHDALTGLANRRELERQLGVALANPHALDCRIALMLLDLRHFKEVNDALGHLAGDRVLEQIAERLTDAAGPNDLVTRFGGDEFAVLLRSAWRPPRVEARARRVLRALSEPVEVDGLPILVEANGGLALAIDPQDEPSTPAAADDDGDGEDAGSESDARGEGDVRGEGDARSDALSPTAGPEGGAEQHRPSGAWLTGPEFRYDPREWSAELMRRADVAMYQAKRTSQPLVRYTIARDPADRARLTLAGQLPRAVAQREFVLSFQPIVDLAGGEVLGAEALARWRHPSRGELEPRWFLDLLERSAQLSAFTAAVLDDALAAADMWRAAGHDLRVSVNISPRSLLDVNLPRQVLEALDRHGTRPDRLCLELTETLALSQLETVDEVLTRLHDIGVWLALDDFGTGFSSLGVLSRIPVHQLKIDRQFVQALRDPDLTGDPEAAAGDSGAGGGEAGSRAGTQVGTAAGARPAGAYAGARPAGAQPQPDPDPDAVTIAQARAVVRSTVQLGRTLELSVVAEGIENLRQRRLLWELGCAAGQGHLFARPQPADRLLADLTRGVGDQPGALAAPLSDDPTVVHLRRARTPGRKPPGR